MLRKALGIGFTRIGPMLIFTVTWAIIPVKPMTLGFYPTLAKKKQTSYKESGLVR